VKHWLDKHGYVFQRAVEERIKELARNVGFEWTVSTAEFPVEAKGRTTRIDLVLQRGPLWIAAECKRVDPAFEWFFAKGGDTLSHRIMVEQFVGDGHRVEAHPSQYPDGTRPYHIAVVGKSGGKGDGTGAGRDQIEEAATQAMVGASGLVNFFANEHLNHSHNVKKWVVPAIITTARLSATDSDISEASLEDGLLAAEVEVQEKQWVWFQYQRSPHLAHDLGSQAAERSPTAANRNLFARSIAIINAAYLGDFLWRFE